MTLEEQVAAEAAEAAEARAANELAALHALGGEIDVARYRWENPRMGYTLLRARGHVEPVDEGEVSVTVKITAAGLAELGL